MIAFISWYILVTTLGWLTFPLAYYLFPALADRGYTLARADGLVRIPADANGLGAGEKVEVVLL